jgi:hypothetical protein
MGKTFAQLSQFPVKFPTTEFDAHELEMTLKIKTLTGLEHKAFIAGLKDAASEVETLALLASVAVEDEDGQGPTFDMAIKWPVSLLKRLSEAVNKFNGFTKEAEEETSKN